MELKALVASELERARARTLDLLAPFDDAELTEQVSPLMSPLVWDLAHIGHFEELWLLRNLAAATPTDARYDDLYDAFAHPRRERATLPILSPDAACAYIAEVRARTLDLLHTIDLDEDNPLLHHAFVYGMVIQHEHQHAETMLATIQLSERPYDLASPERRREAPATAPAAEPFTIGAGAFTMGSDDEPWAYDNERPAHRVELTPLRIDASPVTNARFAEFVADGGYDDPRHWGADGWKWRQEASLAHPQFWRPEGGGWRRLRFGRREDLPGDEPVEHVCWHEADAFARWDGKRLPTEAEWEHAAAQGLDGIGQVWEWTASDFAPYPGFRAFPYPEYSEVFFGPEYKVLRGASWATDRVVARPTFRNWDHPIRRQIFAGFRCAKDG
jgi:gamma-glutamyl hercynylcysteine S-oxide synthase